MPSPAQPSSEAAAQLRAPLGRARAAQLQRCAALALGALAGWLYLATFAPLDDGLVLGNDVLGYARGLFERGGAPEWNPHHLLYHPLAALAYAGLRLVGRPASPEQALLAHQLVSALAGGASVALFARFALARLELASALALSALFALCAGPWLYSAVGESYQPANAALLGLLAASIALRMGWIRAFTGALSAALALACLLRQDSVLVLPALAILWPRALWLRCCAIAGSICVACYALGWWLAHSGLDAWTWLRGLSESGAWGRAPDARAFGTSLFLTLNAFRYCRPEDWQLALLALGPVLLALLPPRRFEPGLARALLALLLYFALRLVFYSWWQPGNLEYQSGNLVPLFLAAALLLRSGAGGWARWRRPLLLGCACLALAQGNWTELMQPYRTREIAWRSQQACHMAAADGLVIALDPLQALALLRVVEPACATLDASSFASPHGADPAIEAQRAALIERARAMLAARASVVLVWDRSVPARQGWPTWSLDDAFLAALLALAPSQRFTDREGQIWAIWLRAASG